MPMPLSFGSMQVHRALLGEDRERVEHWENEEQNIKKKKWLTR